MPHDGALDAKVVGHNPAPTTGGGHRVDLLAGHAGHHVQAVGTDSVGRYSRQRCLVGRAERPGHGALVAQVPGEAPRVNTGDSGHTVGDKHRVQVATGPPVAVEPRHVAYNHPAAKGPTTLVIVVVDSVVSDVRVRERDYLPGIRRVGDDLLIAGEDRVEDHLAGGHAVGSGRSDRLALKDRPIGQDQMCLDPAAPAHRRASPSTTTGSPALMVCLTRPRRVRPS